MAYNHFTPVTDPSTHEQALLIGFEAHLPADAGAAPVPIFDASNGRYLAGAHYMVRYGDGTYDAFSMEDLSLSSPPPRVSVRTLAVSPFASDNGAVVDAGGFDCNSTPVHNTAWALKAPVAIVLGGR